MPRWRGLSESSKVILYRTIHVRRDHERQNDAPDAGGFETELLGFFGACYQPPAARPQAVFALATSSMPLSRYKVYSRG